MSQPDSTKFVVGWGGGGGADDSVKVRQGEKWCPPLINYPSASGRTSENVNFGQLNYF